jgi:uncharacterized protein
MQFDNSFTVQAPLEQVWQTLLDVERVAPCMPGAQVLERLDEDSYAVGVRVKLGPISMQYRGQVEIVERDEEEHSAVLAARARETRGQGTADARMRMELRPSGEGTEGSIHTDLTLSGKAATMGQGVVRDVSARLVSEFAQNLAAMLAGEGAAEAAAGNGLAPAAAAGGGNGAAPQEPQARPAQAESSIEVGSLVGGVVAERLRSRGGMVAGALALAAAGVAAGLALGRRLR